MTRITPRLAYIAMATVLLATSFALALSGCTNSEASRPAATSETTPVAVTTVAAAERVLPRTLEVTGQLMGDAQTEVAAEVAGRILQVMVERGANVRAGDVLARLDQEDAANQLREMEAVERQTRERLGLAEGDTFDPHRTPDVRRARLAMKRAETDYHRYVRLVDQGLVSRQEFDVRRTEYTTAREQHDAIVNQVRELAQAREAQRARVAMARTALADTQIRAPFDGVVAERQVNVGQYLARGARVATLVRVDPLRIELQVPEAAVAVVKRGQKVSFTVQTHPDRRFEGAVAYVGPSLRTDARALTVEAVVANRMGALQPGLFATASIELPAMAQGVVVPPRRSGRRRVSRDFM